MQKIKTGLCSFGMSGSVFHAPLIETHAGYELVSICRRSSSAPLEGYPQTAIVQSLEELLAQDLELVIVNTPNHLHHAHVQAALLAGKHVVVEKPFTVTTQEADNLLELATKQGLVLSVFHNRRWDSDFLTVKQVIAEGLLGKLVDCRAHYDRYRNYIQPNTWKEEPVSGGGLLYNLGSHLIDQALVLFGLPRQLFAHLRTQRNGGIVDDNFELILDYEGLKVSLNSGYLVREPYPRFSLHGTLGSFIKYGLDVQEEDLKQGKTPGSPNWGQEPAAIWGQLHTQVGGLALGGTVESMRGNYLTFYDELYGAISQGGPAPVSAAQARQVVRLIELAHQSHRQGRMLPVVES
ncbi:MAG: Gfo/Idh/MocA family oxidoreductase [Cytophagales bacterium]|nr:Gfo/Idh/MocA family oxidoreductase [Cytophagales bacterium]